MRLSSEPEVLRFALVEMGGLRYAAVDGMTVQPCLQVRRRGSHDLRRSLFARAAPFPARGAVRDQHKNLAGTSETCRTLPGRCSGPACRRRRRGWEESWRPRNGRTGFFGRRTSRASSMSVSPQGFCSKPAALQEWLMSLLL